MAAVAYQTIADLSSVPVLEVIDASARIATKNTRTKAVGVIGTPATINSNAYARAIHLLDKDVKVFSQACPLFVPLVEEGWFDHPATRLIAQEYLKPVIAEQIDTLVLGCTHYPLLKPLLQNIMGKSVSLVDSAEAMADIAADLIDKQNQLYQDEIIEKAEYYKKAVEFQRDKKYFNIRTCDVPKFESSLIKHKIDFFREDKNVGVQFDSYPTETYYFKEKDIEKVDEICIDLKLITQPYSDVKPFFRFEIKVFLVFLVIVIIIVFLLNR